MGRTNPAAAHSKTAAVSFASSASPASSASCSSFSSYSLLPLGSRVTLGRTETLLTQRKQTTGTSLTRHYIAHSRAALFLLVFAIPPSAQKLRDPCFKGELPEPVLSDSCPRNPLLHLEQPRYFPLHAYVTFH